MTKYGAKMLKQKQEKREESMGATSTKETAKATKIKGRGLLIGLATLWTLLLLLAVIGSAVSAVRLQALRSRSAVGSLTTAAQLANNDPRSTHISLSSPDGTTRLDIVRAPNGQTFATGGTVPVLPSDSIYQLWAMSDNVAGNVANNGVESATSTSTPATSSAKSLGFLHVFDATSPTGAFIIPAHATTIFLTREPATGAITPTTPYIAKGSIPADLS